MRNMQALLVTGTLLNFSLYTPTTSCAQPKPASKPSQQARQQAAHDRDQKQKAELAIIKSAEHKANELLAQEKADPSNPVLQQNRREAFHEVAVAMSNYGDKYVPLQKTLPSLQHTYLTGRYYELSGNAPAARAWYLACQKSPTINAPSSVWEGTPLSQLVKAGLARVRAAGETRVNPRSGTWSHLAIFSHILIMRHEGAYYAPSILLSRAASLYGSSFYLIQADGVLLRSRV